MTANDPNSPAPQKGLSGLAIAGLGCGVALLLIIGVVGAVVWTVAPKVKQFASEFEKNPVKAAAMLVVRANPDWDLVKTDDAAGAITVRDKKSGEEITMSFNELAEGKFRVKNSKGEETVFGAGAATPPDWVPAYPGWSAMGVGMKTEKPDTVSGTFTAQVSDPVEKVRAFFDEKLKADGYETETTATESGGGARAGTAIKAVKSGEKRTITVLIQNAGNATQLVLTYEGPK